MIRFHVEDLEKCPLPDWRHLFLSQTFGKIFKTPVEACGSTAQDIVPTGIKNGLVGAIHTAYGYHYDLALSPEDIWLAISQGFANHVNAKAEELRSSFVQHEGKENITIRRDFFVKGSPDNDWPGCFDEFAEKIDGYLNPDARGLLVSNFSTTTPLTKAVSNLVLMDAMQAYFSYGVSTCCGIPNITLFGTTQDWERILERTKGLGRFGCQEWVDVLTPILEQFVEASKGNADKSFWARIYKVSGGSGGPYLSGWFLAFFPYLINPRTKKNTTPNSFLKECLSARPRFGGLTTSNIPSGVCGVPFQWHYYGVEFPMHFYGGLVGAEVKDSTFRPVIGWGVGA